MSYRYLNPNIAPQMMSCKGSYIHVSSECVNQSRYKSTYSFNSRYVFQLISTEEPPNIEVFCEYSQQDCIHFWLAQSVMQHLVFLSGHSSEYQPGSMWLFYLVIKQETVFHHHKPNFINYIKLLCSFFNHVCLTELNISGKFFSVERLTQFILLSGSPRKYASCTSYQQCAEQICQP